MNGATFNIPNLIMNIRAVNVFAGELIHLAAVVHNVQYAFKYFLNVI